MPGRSCRACRVRALLLGEGQCDFDQRAGISRENFERSTQGGNAFLQADKTHPSGLAVLNIAKLVGGKTAAVIADGKQSYSVVESKRDVYFFASRVAVYVGQAFLKNAKQSCFQFLRQPP
jgi:hypothetical protein